jgi:phytoene/squalene synthetase
LADKDLEDDCMRAYAYFRWADDVIDVSAQSLEERIAFIRRQKELVNRLYRREGPRDLTQEEYMIADLIEHDREENSGLQSFIRNFIAVLEFDAGRKGKLTSQAELTWYSKCLGQSVTDAIQYFIGNDHSCPNAENRYLAATAAHITHMLRDMSEGLAEGFVNIPQEWLEAHNISMDTNDIGSEDLKNPPFRAWVQSQVEQAREYFGEGKRYLDELDVLRCKIAGYWYCVRFECVLDAIERDGYVLRTKYDVRRKSLTWFKMGWLAVSLTLRHFIRRGRHSSRDAPGDSVFEVTIAKH